MPKLLESAIAHEAGFSTFTTLPVVPVDFFGLTLTRTHEATFGTFHARSFPIIPILGFQVVVTLKTTFSAELADPLGPAELSFFPFATAHHLGLKALGTLAVFNTYISQECYMGR